MEITNADLRKKHDLIMSIFERDTRPFTEPKSATEDMIIGPGRSLPDLIKLYYPGAVPHAFKAKWGLLDRDNKERTYEPAVEDKYILNGANSIAVFKKNSMELIQCLKDMWTGLGLPVKMDKDRKVELPDTEIAFMAMNKSHPLHEIIIKNYDVVTFIVSNIDIMKKVSLVRSIAQGWWCVSYRGKNAVDAKAFAASLAAHKNAIDIIMASKGFRTIYDQLWQEAGDPLDTNVGYPFNEAIVSKDNMPITRIKTVELMEGIVKQAGYNWDKLLKIIDDRGGAYSVPGYPLSVFPIRRLSAGYKWAHQFHLTPNGMKTAFDERGMNSQRVAWAVPYLYNVILTPFQIILKALRQIIPGLSHTGQIKKNRTAFLLKHRDEIKMGEADYGNYDRFIPVDLIRDLMQHISKKLPNSEYWLKASMYLHDDANVIWPDYSSAIQAGAGWIFKPGLHGLMSGVKITSESGTLINSIINGQALMNEKGWSVNELTAYLTQYVDNPIETNGTKMEYFWVQSDDSLPIASSYEALKKRLDLFMDLVVKAGLKGSAEVGNRFLMRNVDYGLDRPVPSRVWQNTLSNETPPENVYVFLAGLAARTDGLLGIKHVDPFGTGSVQAITGAELVFTVKMLTKLRESFETAKVRVETAIELVTLLIVAGNKYLNEALKNPSKRFKLDGGHVKELSRLRDAIARALADYEMTKLKGDDLTKQGSWLYQLYKDRNVPSSALILDQLMVMRPDLKAPFEMIGNREHKFFLYAAQKLGVQPLFH